jgi:cytochrome c oxidase subunit 2
VVLSVVTFFFLGDVKNPPASSPGGLNASATQFATIDQSRPPGPPKDNLQVEVNGQQYLWRYRYPNGAFSYYDMVVPYDTTVVLNITSSDVIHSWWVPKLGGQQVRQPHVVQDHREGP